MLPYKGSRSRKYELTKLRHPEEKREGRQNPGSAQNLVGGENTPFDLRGKKGNERP